MARSHRDDEDLIELGNGAETKPGKKGSLDSSLGNIDERPRENKYLGWEKTQQTPRNVRGQGGPNIRNNVLNGKKNRGGLRGSEHLKRFQRKRAAEKRPTRKNKLTLPDWNAMGKSGL